jgi:Family of unknown function (DUF6262)
MPNGATRVHGPQRALRRRSLFLCQVSGCDASMAGTHPRNVAGMVQHAEARRSGARQRAENAIRALVDRGEEVNFRRVSEVGRVSSAFLYRELDLAERIRQLRVQGDPRPAHHSTERASDASKDAIIKTLRLRIAELEQTRRELTVYFGQTERPFPTKPNTDFDSAELTARILGRCPAVPV